MKTLLRWIESLFFAPLRRTIVEQHARLGRLEGALEASRQKERSLASELATYRDLLSKLLMECVRIKAIRHVYGPQKTLHVELDLSDELILASRHGTNEIVFCLAHEIAAVIANQRRPSDGLLVRD